VPDHQPPPRATQIARPDVDATDHSEDWGSWRDAARWWEPRRVLYNLILLAVFGALALRTWDRLAPQLSLGNIGRLFALALLANLCYSAAYPADLTFQTDRPPTLRSGWRWVIWIAGTLFAVLLTTYWYLDEILPPPG